MGTDNGRKAARAACDFPVRLGTRTADLLHADVVDVSRTGTRVRIAGDLLGIHRLSSLAQIARVLSRTLGDLVDAEMHYEALGPLLHKDLKPVRIANRDWEQAHVEVGFLFDAPLGDDELGLLGVSLPPLGGNQDATTAFRPQLIHGGGRRQPAGFETWLLAGEGRKAPPLRTRTESLTPGMAILSIEDVASLPFASRDVVSVVVGLDQSLGCSLTVRMVDGEEEIWVGPGEIKEVDVDASGAGNIRLGVAFGREFRSDELHRLGLPAPA